MSGDLLVWFTTCLIVLVIALIMIITTVMLHRTVRSETATFYCPWMRRSVMARFLSHDGIPVGVASCTAFADPRVVTCGGRCIFGVEGGEPVPDEAEGRA
jgi:hypothetical protein